MVREVITFLIEKLIGFGLTVELIDRIAIYAFNHYSDLNGAPYSLRRSRLKFSASS